MTLPPHDVLGYGAGFAVPFFFRHGFTLPKSLLLLAICDPEHLGSCPAKV